MPPWSPAGQLRDAAAVNRLLPRLEAAVKGDAAGERLARLLAAEAALAQGDAARALKLVELDGRRRPDVLLGTQALVQTGKAADAAQRLQTWSPRTRAMRRRGNSSRQRMARRASACAQCAPRPRLGWRNWITQAALDRFKAGQEMARKGGAQDYIEGVDHRHPARQVESLLREQALER
jgi:hypothetical protein